MRVKRFLGVLVMGLCVACTLRAENCTDLTKGSTAMTTITLAAKVEAGNFVPVGGREIAGLPAFCRVAATLKPTPDSEIHIEVWLPSDWNGKLMAAGSGGWGGSIGYGGMAEALRRGYATAATDDGHTGGSASFVVGHPEKLIDFAYRAEHEMTVEAKRLIEVFYGRAPKFSYWNGCSGGGREGLLQAARYPDEFDGIIAGDPANIRRNAWALWVASETFKNPETSIPSAKYRTIHNFVMNACDAADGLKDGLIEEPESCKPDFAKLECKGADGAECLTAAQVKAVNAIVSPATGASGKVWFPRLEPGAELQWGRLAGGPEPASLFLDEFRYVVYANPRWDWRSFELDRDAAKAHAVDKDVDEMNPHLEAFVQRGGKLLLYHGWADQQVAPMSSVEFYEDAVKDSGDPKGEWIRLFMAPGMGHCGGGEGPDSFDKIGALEEWVERGKAPEEIVAEHRSDGKVDRRRPLCAYPMVARYNGTGDVNDAASFHCAASSGK